MRMKTNEMAKSLVAHLAKFNIASSDAYYAKSMGLEPALDGVEGETTVANQLSGKTVCIPITPFLTTEDVQFIAQKVNSFQNERSLNEAPGPQL